MQQLTCQQCGKVFELPAWAVKAGRGKYCSHPCFAAAMRGRARTALQKRTTKACVVCGTEFVTGGRVGSADKAFCSSACRHAARYRHGRRCAELSPMDAAYLAGFWDADGTFILHGRNQETVSITFRVHAGGTRPDVIEWIKEVTGIGVVQRRTPKNPNAHDVWVWTVNGDAAESFARQLLPYLRLKRERAELGVAFQERLRDPKRKAERGWQAEWMERLREMNRKGRAAVELAAD